MSINDNMTTRLLEGNERNFVGSVKFCLKSEFKEALVWKTKRSLNTSKKLVSWRSTSIGNQKINQDYQLPIILRYLMTKIMWRGLETISMMRLTINYISVIYNIHWNDKKICSASNNSIFCPECRTERRPCHILPIIRYNAQMNIAWNT